MFDSAALLTCELIIQKGRIVRFEENGKILIEDNEKNSLLSCYFIRTAQGKLPDLHIGDAVLYVLDSNQEQGYILGLIQLYTPSLDIPKETNQKSECSEDKLEVKLPGKLEKVHVNGKKIQIEADEEIFLKCGKGSILINRQGKIVIRGTNLISRSKGMNKIKGAGVSIN